MHEAPPTNNDWHVGEIAIYALGSKVTGVARAESGSSDYRVTTGKTEKTSWHTAILWTKVQAVRLLPPCYCVSARLCLRLIYEAPPTDDDWCVITL